jgi:hypothetical protein
LSENPKCELCQLPMVPIVYGLPTEETFEKAEAGEFALGGCVVRFDDPKWACLNCAEK